MQHKAVYYSAGSLYMFRVSTTPISRSTQNSNYSLRYWSYILCGYLPQTWPGLAMLEGGSCTVPEAVVTVLCIPDDGCGWQPKYVEWSCRIINRLLSVASRWTIININTRMLRQHRPQSHLLTSFPFHVSLVSQPFDCAQCCLKYRQHWQ